MFEIQMLEEFVRRSDHYEAGDFRTSISTNTNPILGKADRLVLVGCDLGSLFGRLAAQRDHGTYHLRLGTSGDGQNRRRDQAARSAIAYASTKGAERSQADALPAWR
jgi:hypothetical protein